MSKPQPRKRNRQPDQKKHAIRKPEKIAIPQETRAFIRQHYKSMPRREIAKSLQLDKVTLNMMIIEMGMGG